MDHFYYHIHGWFRAAELYRAMVIEARSSACFVEIGAWKGRSTSFMAVEILNSGKIIDFHVVDWFKGSDEYEHQIDPDVQEGRLLEVFETNLAPLLDRITIHATESTEAARRFADGSVDFVFVDASHDYASVKADVLAWLPKVRPGGLLAGDDYGVFPGVDRAVRELLPAHENPTWPIWTFRK
jgi:hypothetical protein